MTAKEGGPTTRERAETVRALLEELAVRGPQDGERLRGRIEADDEAFEQAAQDVWEAGLVAYRMEVRAGTARTVLALTSDGESVAS